MTAFCARIARAVCRNSLFGLLVVSAGFPVRAMASEGFTIVRVEEDWEVLVSSPQTNCNSPQVTCAMSPVGDDESAYMSFELNHQSQPGYAAGGLHLHGWEGDYLQGSVHTQANTPLQAANELVRWTQSMTLSGGTLTYEITNGSSETWGTFGTGELKLTLSTGLTSLNAYRVEGSLNLSGVGFGANRVSSMVLKRLRVVTDGGDVYEVNVNHDVLHGSGG